MRRMLFEGPAFSVEERDVIVRGKRHKFIRMLENSSSVIIPFLSGERIILEKQYRHAIEKWVYELPAGHIENGESAKEAAVRELGEETGYSAGSMRFLFKTYELPDLTSAIRHYYVARGLTRGKRHTEPTEQISLVTVTIKKALEMIDDNTIDDPCTIIGILYYCRKFKV